MSSNNKQETVFNAESQLKIIDLNDDCLMHIFQMLDLEDLINVGAANRLLAESAAIIFKMEYGIQFIIVLNDIIEIRDMRGYRRMKSEDSKILINFLIAFGSSLHSLTFEIKADHLTYHCKQIEQAINENCSETILYLKLVYLEGVGVMEEIKKPFKKIEQLVIFNGRLNKHFTQFNYWFPNLLRLVLYHNDLTDPWPAENNCPNLKHLPITFGDIWNGSWKQNIETFLRENSHLRELYLPSDYWNKDYTEWVSSQNFIRIINNFMQLEILEFGPILASEINNSIDNYRVLINTLPKLHRIYIVHYKNKERKIRINVTIPGWIIKPGDPKIMLFKIK